MGAYVLDFREIDQRHAALVGGKGALLGELAQIDEVRVPAGFCVTTDAFLRILGETPAIDDRLEQLSNCQPDDRDAIAALSSELRQAVEQVSIPEEVAAEVSEQLVALDDQVAYAVRSSATGEDSATASFAGQYDTYLNITGAAAILEHLTRCWASFFTDRAVTYRLQKGLDQRASRMAVVVQQMVFPHSAGILFTADPVTCNRKLASIEAGFGLGEAIVSGLANADVYTVRRGQIIARVIATKRFAIEASVAGGTEAHELDPQRQRTPALTDPQIVRLEQLGRRIEAHFGHPQDIEWCLCDGDLWIVQSRPITTLFPIPPADDDGNHVYVSVGHQQMMTDAMKPLGLSFWQLTTPRPMREAGGRLFVDVTPLLASPVTRAGLVEVWRKSDPLIGSALQVVVDRDDFLPAPPDEPPAMPPGAGPPVAIEADPEIVTELIARSQASIATLKREIATLSGPALIEFILADIQELRRILFDPSSREAIMAGMEASWWLNEHLLDWLGEKNAADPLTRSVPGNITSEMGLALLDVADAVRPYPELVAFLHGVHGDDDYLADLGSFAGGGDAQAAIEAYLDRYGMRCVGEIDITRPRWSERPSTLVPMILGNVREFEPGEAARRLARGEQEAQAKERDLVERLRRLPDGEQKASETKRMIDQVRTFAGYREYPKYGMVSRYFVYKQALLAEAERLVKAQVLSAKEDIFYLRLPELQDVVGRNVADDRLIRERAAAFRSFEPLSPPRVSTSDGEVITGEYGRDDVPAGALVGLPVSAGTVEGRARVVLDVGEAELEAGDILVTAYTDPSWAPLFVAAHGLVTEVGGTMTHGAVIAREYGLPAVVSVEHATRLIRDGQQIRVHGTAGYVELLPDPVTALR